MKSNRMLLTLWVIMLVATLLAAGDPWTNKPFTEWTAEEVAAINKNSPWAKTLLGNSDLPAQVTVQWASSLTLRQAAAREGQLQGTMTQQQVAQLLAMGFQQYVIAVRGEGVTTLISGYAELTEEALRRSTYLQPKDSQRKIYPLGMEVNLEGKEPTATFYFPREDSGQRAIGLSEKEVDFLWQSEKNRLRVTFDLTQMTRSGKPDL